MPAQARVETRATWNDVDLQNGIRASENRLQAFQGKVQRLFRRDPGARAERALGGFVGALATGNVPLAIEGLAGRLRGLGLAAGIGLGAAVIVIQKAKQQLDAVDKSVKEVNKDLSRPLALQSALGPEGIGKEIETAKKDMDDLIGKRKGWFQSAREAAIAGQPDWQGDPHSSQKSDVNRVPAAAKAQQEIGERLKQLASARADAEVEVVRARIKGLKVSEEDGEVAKINLGYREKLAKLILERGPHGGPNISEAKRALALQADRQLSIEVAHKKAAIAQAEAEMTERIQHLAESGLTIDQQKIAALKERLGYLRQELSLTSTREGKRDIGLQIGATQNQLRRSEFNEFRKPGSEKLAENIAATRDKNDYNFWLRHYANPQKEQTWDERFPKAPSYPKGKNWAVEMIQRGRQNEQSVYQTNPIFRGLEFGADNTSDISKFGSGSFLNAKPGIKSGLPSSREEGKDAIGLSAAIKAAFEEVMAKYWGG